MEASGSGGATEARAWLEKSRLDVGELESQGEGVGERSRESERGIRKGDAEERGDQLTGVIRLEEKRNVVIQVHRGKAVGDDGIPN